MFDFVILKNSQEKNFAFNSNGWNEIENSSHLFFFKAQKHQLFKFDGKTILIIGDYWNLPSEKDLQTCFGDFEYLIKTIKGGYYYFLFDDEVIEIISGFLNLNPVYYSSKYRFSTSSYKLIKDSLLSFKVSEQYILETALLNHAFSDKTIYEEVKLLKTHCALKFEKDNVNSEQFWDVTKLYSNKPSSKKADYMDIVSTFVSTVNQYIPDKNTMISFTGGFDGRTIVSSSLYLKKKFDVFAFGKNINDDVYIPQKNSLELGLNFEQIDAADQTYINNHFKDNAVEIIEETGAFNGLLYPHFLFLAKVLSKKTNTITTGYGGSELFRATHIFGAVTSRALYDVITIDDRQALKTKLLSSPNLKMLSDTLIKNNIDQLVRDIFDFKKILVQHNTKNKQLYAFMLNESMRKIFGIWQSSQQRYINVRSPFFDYNLIEKVFQTNLAGIYNDFYTKNPVKRFKGQLFYALAIKATNKVIYNQVTGKGYAPKDLLTLRGKISIVYPFFKKRFTRKVKKQCLDNLSIISGAKVLLKEKPIQINEKFFNKNEFTSVLKTLDEFTPESTRDSFLNTISISIFLQ